MKRFTLCLTLLSLAFPAWAGDAKSGRPLPHRYKISSFGVWVRTNAPGQPAYRYTYRGQAYGAMPPAIFTYGYEHTMQDNGPNTLNGPWH